MINQEIPEVSSKIENPIKKNSVISGKFEVLNKPSNEENPIALNKEAEEEFLIFEDPESEDR